MKKLVFAVFTLGICLWTFACELGTEPGGTYCDFVDSCLVMYVDENNTDEGYLEMGYQIGDQIRCEDTRVYKVNSSLCPDEFAAWGKCLNEHYDEACTEPGSAGFKLPADCLAVYDALTDCRNTPD